ncbi:MAG TPA: hypothetical protein VHV10_11910 [Ktedonobacteraceae bacterium]|nr:hypothetical protein [Ktedonobacteraceae bacterium]
MDKDKRPFTPESVDDEIYQLINSSSSISSKARLIHELCHTYKENANSLNRVWERIERYSMERQTSQDHTAQRPRARTLQRQAVSQHILLPLKKGSSNAKHPASQPFTVLAASIIGVFLVGSLAWVLGIAHLAAPGVKQASGSISAISAFQRAKLTHTQLNILAQPMIAIRMLDTIHGWALTQHSILKTADGGVEWQNVTPANAFSDTPPGSTPRGDFLNDRYAWVVTPVVIPPNTALSTIRVLRTTDGGKSWQSTTIDNTTGSATDMPHFLNPSDGWLQTFGQPRSGKSNIFYTTDGGKSWYEPGKLNQNYIPDPTGISFSDIKTGWETGDNPTATISGAINNAQPLLDVTHDGALTWQSQSLPVLPGAGKSDMVSTTPPVFFGSDGLLPVMDQIVPPHSSIGNTQGPSTGFDLYVTHDGGQSWTPTKLVTSTITSNEPSLFTVYVADMQHVWAALGTKLYATSDGGQNWTQLPPTPQPIEELSFVDTNNGWAIGLSNATTLSPVLHTTDGGHTWQQITASRPRKPL